MSASSFGAEAASSPHRWTRIAERGSLWGLRFTAWLLRAAGRGPTLVLVTAIVGYFFLTDRAGRRASAAYLRRVYATAAGRAGARARAAHLGQLPPLPGLRALDRRSALDLVRKDGRLPARDPRLRAVRPARRAEARRDRAGGAPGELRRDADAGRPSQDGRQRPDVHGPCAAHQPDLSRALARGRDARDLRGSRARSSPSSRFAAAWRGASTSRSWAIGSSPAIGAARAGFPSWAARCELPQAPFLLASLLGCPVLLVVALRRGPQRYQVFTELLAEKVQLPRRGREAAVRELLTSYAARLEHHCQRAPYEWFNFYDYWGDGSGDAETAPRDRVSA